MSCTLTINIEDEVGIPPGENIDVTLGAGTTGATYDSATLGAGTCVLGGGAGTPGVAVSDPTTLLVTPDADVDLNNCTIIVNEVLDATSAGQVCQTLDSESNDPPFMVCAEIEPGPVGGCPPGDGWNLELVSEAIPDLDNGNFADQNGDGWGCFKVNKGQSAKHGTESWTWKDNTNPLPEV
ncbi:MAG: hypothetical protein ACRDMW_06360 [Gaiellaceae bacterium]